MLVHTGPVSCVDDSNPAVMRELTCERSSDFFRIAFKLTIRAEHSYSRHCLNSLYMFRKNLINSRFGESCAWKIGVSVS